MSTAAWVASIAAVGGAVWFVAFTALVAGSQFYTDDLLYLQQGARDNITWTWLSQESYGHFAPIFRLIYAFVARVGGVDWALAAAVLATLLTLMFAALAWFTTLLVGRRPLALIIAVAGATSIPALRTTLWMASGVQVIGGAMCMAFCIAGFIAYLKSGRRLAIVVSLGALAVGLVWQERPILTIGYLVLIRYLFFPPSRAPRRQWLTREALLWAPYLTVIVVYLGYRLFVFDSSPAPGTLAAGWSLFKSGLVRSYLPSLLGVRLDQDAGWFEPASIVGALLLVGAFVALAITRRGAWRCVVFLLATYAAGRLGADGGDAVALSRDLQYFVDPYLATLFALCLGAALPRREPRPFRSLVPAVAVVVAAIVGVVTALSWTDVVRNNAQTGAHSYLDRAIAELEADGPVDLVSLKVPYSVAFPFVDPYTDQVQFLTVDKQLATDIDATSPRKVVIASDGSVVPVHPVTLGHTGDMAASARAIGPGATLTAGPAGACLSGGARSAIKVKLPAAAPIPEAAAFQLTYTSGSDAKIRVVPYRGAESGTDQWPSVLRAGTDRTVVGRLDGEPGDGLLIVSPKRVRDLCISDVWIGMLAIDTPDGCRVINHFGDHTDQVADCSRSWPAQ